MKFLFVSNPKFDLLYFEIFDLPKDPEIPEHLEVHYK